MPVARTNLIMLRCKGMFCDFLASEQAILWSYGLSIFLFPCDQEYILKYVVI